MENNFDIKKLDFYQLSVDVFNSTDSESQIDLIQMLLEKFNEKELKEFIDSSFFGEINLSNYVTEEEK